jgi:very-short-patch-repair endonuclease
MKGSLESRYEEATKAERWEILREHYTRELPNILREAERDLHMWAVPPYVFDWRFNRNEKAVWGDIRRREAMVMYPEFPALNYFVDFGHPYLRIAIEADSRKYHERQRDIERDRRLYEIGWKVFRSPYRENIDASFIEHGDIHEMMMEGSEEEASRELEHWLLNTSDGLVDAIYFFYFMSPDKRAAMMERYPDYLGLAKKSLRRHRNIDFPLPNVLGL